MVSATVQCAGTRELAAMGPANIVFSFSQYIFQALQIAAIRCELHHVLQLLRGGRVPDSTLYGTISAGEAANRMFSYVA